MPEPIIPDPNNPDAGQGGGDNPNPNPNPSQDPNNGGGDGKPSKDKKEQLEAARRKKFFVDDEIKKLETELGQPPKNPSDPNATVTVAMLDERDRKKAQDEAVTMADKIEDPKEKEAVIFHLSNSVKPTGDPAKDLQHARAIVFAEKNKKIFEETQRKQNPPQSGSGSGAPPNYEAPFEVTPQEKQFMGPPFNLTLEQIKKSRGTS